MRVGERWNVVCAFLRFEVAVEAEAQGMIGGTVVACRWTQYDVLY